MSSAAPRGGEASSLRGRIALLDRRRRRLLSCVRQLQQVESRIRALRSRLDGLFNPTRTDTHPVSCAVPAPRPNTRMRDVYEIVREAGCRVRIGEVWRVYNRARGNGYLSEMRMTGIICGLARRGLIRRVGKGLYEAREMQVSPPAATTVAAVTENGGTSRARRQRGASRHSGDQVVPPVAAPVPDRPRRSARLAT